MADIDLARDALVVVGTALAGGAGARALRQPVLVGYLVGGVAAGPAGLNLLHGAESVGLMAEFGVGLLLFALGVEFSLSDLGRVGRLALGGGALQILATLGLGMAAVVALGWPITAAAYIGVALALSSTAVALKVLGDRGDLDAPHGRVVIGFMLVQDLAAVPALVLLPALSAPGGDLLPSLAVSLLKVGAFLAVGLVVGTRAGPWFLGRVAASGSRELFMLAVITLIGATMLAAQAVGMSLAFGAFLAGLLVSESDYAQQVLADIIPLRDTLAGFFFVSLGVLVDPAAALAALPLLALLLAVVLAKGLITMLAVRLFRYPSATGLLAGATVSQMGEFSFVVAQLGVAQGALPSHVYGTLLAAAIVSMVLTPGLLSAAERLVYLGRAGSGRWRWLTQPPALPDQPGPDKEGTPLINHAVVCGYGRVGRHLVPVLRRRGLPVLVVDTDPQAQAELRHDGIPCVYGDAATRPVLDRCNLPRARVLVITLGDRMATEVALRQARAINPRLDVVMRAPSHGDWSRLRELGAAEIVQPEFEAGLELLRHTLHRYGISGTEIQLILNQLRIEEGERE